MSVESKLIRNENILDLLKVLRNQYVSLKRNIGYLKKYSGVLKEQIEYAKLKKLEKFKGLESKEESLLKESAEELNVLVVLIFKEKILYNKMKEVLTLQDTFELNAALKKLEEELLEKIISNITRKTYFYDIDEDKLPYVPAIPTINNIVKWIAI